MDVLSIPSILANLLFGTIGFFVFLQGKKQANFKTLGIGIALMVYPYFVSNSFLLYGIGVGLIAALFLFRD